MQSFYHPYLANAKLAEKPGRAEAEIMFHRVDELLAFHEPLLASLQAANSSWPQECLSSIFLRMVPRMDVFTEVIRQHSASLHAIKTAKKVKTFALFLKETEAKHGDVTELIKLSHQRIPIYSQFLSALSTLGKPNEWDLEEAVVQLNRLQYTLETSKRFSRDQGKILELEAKLENQGLDRFSLGETGRTLIREGVLAVTVQRGLTAGWPGPICHYAFIPNMSAHFLFTPGDGKNGFQISATTGEWTLYATTPAERKGWMDNLNYYVQQCKKYKTYGLAIEELMERERSECRPVPVILEQFLHALRADPAIVRTEGLFRLAGSALAIKQLTHKIDIGEALDFSSIETHALAGLLKLWLRSLPEPLLTHELYQSFIDAVDGRNEVAALKDVVAQLPIYNKYTLRHLIAFLVEVTSHSDVNKMVSSNMAIVFGPNLLVKRGASIYDCSDVHLQQAVVKALIDSYDQIFEGIEEEEAQFVAQMRIVNEEKQRLLDQERRESMALRPSLSLRIPRESRTDDLRPGYRPEWEASVDDRGRSVSDPVVLEREQQRHRREREEKAEAERLAYLQHSRTAGQHQQAAVGPRTIQNGPPDHCVVQGWPQHHQQEYQQHRRPHEVTATSSGFNSAKGEHERGADTAARGYGEDCGAREEEEKEKRKKKIRLKNRLAEVDEAARKGKEERRRRSDKNGDKRHEEAEEWEQEAPIPEKKEKKKRSATKKKGSSSDNSSYPTGS
ncbi:RhoGAP domain containing protein [Acanthamoeba castellanii str. Neff]|uniref:RhoGAP domain containing protein n=1 Tax=Acanthamoeba castellanii (strain ATCC 30010 / Neff) TaxID=1257118 RepID=L8GJP9_ACACF|nr:RhoGAP domain containing protein [Acanthamoeba castellanii str. Neff]ELR12416.1 RhoGAP domain containing protein [Acanthamoeba castellanii str. Neff]